MNGKGIFNWPSGRKYIGEYINDKKHGHGIYIYENGKLF